MDQLRDREPIEDLSTDGTTIDQPAVAKARNVRRDRRLRQPEGGDEVAHPRLTISQSVHDRQPSAVRQAVKQGSERPKVLLPFPSIHRHATMIAASYDDEPAAKEPLHLQVGSNPYGGSGFSASALRYYEGIGLVAPSTRTDAGYRLYDDRSLARLGFISRAKKLDCSLEEIIDL